MESPRVVALFLLAIGTVFFSVLFMGTLILRSSEDMLSIFTAYAAIILAFIGGLHQATGIQEAEHGLVVIVGIIVALIGFAAIVVERMFQGITLLPVLGITYAILALLEARHSAWRRLQYLLCVSERRPAMLLAGAFCALAPVSHGKIVTSIIAAIFVAIACILAPQKHEKGALDGCVIVCGSKNPCKIAAVEQAVAQYKGVRGVVSYAAMSGVPDQPIGLSTIIRGAQNRAIAAFKKAAAADISLGIESGLFSLQDPNYSENNEDSSSKNKKESVHQHQLYDICIVSAFDGHQHHLGLSCAFEIPAHVRRQVVDNGLDLSAAANASGLSSDPYIGQNEGLISILTRRRLTRKEYTIQAIHMALVALDHPGWYDEDHRSRR